MERPRDWGAALAPFFATTGAPLAHDAFHWLNEINKASAVMVVATGIVPPALGAAIAAAVTRVIAEGDEPGAERSGDYLRFERRFVAIGGPEVTRLHSGRSRQDIAATMRRLFLRETVLEAATALCTARAALLALAAKYPNAIVPAYTWGVQAQPLTLGHYLLAYEAALTRHADRMREAWTRLNLSPLGAAALGTSSFPVDRALLAELLGFDGLVENSLDANQISPIDGGAELAGIAASAALTVATFVADITAQYAQTKPWLILAEGELTGVSSIMPQKRNPMALVELRARASLVLGNAQTFLLLAHNVASGMGDYKLEQGDKAIREMGAMLDALAALVRGLVFDAARALAEVNADYSTTTELADTLQRVSDVPFRVGHHFASELVTYGRSRDLRPAEIPYAEAQRVYADAARHFRLADARLPLDEARFRAALSAAGMVAASQGTGGPQPAEVARMLEAASSRLAEDEAWLAARRAALDRAAADRAAAFARLGQRPPSS